MGKSPASVRYTDIRQGVIYCAPILTCRHVRQAGNLKLCPNTLGIGCIKNVKWFQNFNGVWWKVRLFMLVFGADQIQEILKDS